MQSFKRFTLRYFKRFSQTLYLIFFFFVLIFCLYLCRQIIENCIEVKSIPKQIKTYPNYYEDDLHPNWVFNISRNYDDHQLRIWTEAQITVNNSIVWSQGENGEAFVPQNNDEKDEMNKLKEEYNFNVYASDRISLRRSLPDYRFSECHILIYPDKLPLVSVVIVFHNEAWSALLRTVWSIIDRSPSELLHEIILVDDASTWSCLKRPLDDYIETLSVNINIIRNSKREGLIRSRVIGARNATGSVLTFLDAHVECTKGWLEPTLARIANDRSVIVVPLIDSISLYDMSYKPSPVFIYGLHMYLLFNWMDVPERERLRTNYDNAAPLRTPTHVGCAFSIDREFFFEIGTYDEQMDIWGSENVEMAFRAWMSGGSLEILPCSRIGHLYRASTYSFDGNKEEIMNRNNVRLVEVWMDEFKDIFYAVCPSSKNVSPGDLTERKNLRKQLNCKSFRWYLENIYPESSMLKEYISMGEVRSVSSDTCMHVEIPQSGQKLNLNECHGYGLNQFIGFAKSDQITVSIAELCLGTDKNSTILVECSEEDKSQLWSYDNEKQWITNRESNLCMKNDGNAIVLDVCNLTDNRFQWKNEHWLEQEKKTAS